MSTATLLSDLDAFYTEHRWCDGLETGVEGSVVWLECACGARIVRRVTEDDSG
jgi:hypothetical protein